jgi:limonene-1,2-epoxide hydrolase
MKAGKNKQVIMNFINALTAGDSDRVQSFFSDTSTFRDDSGQILVGQQAIWDAIARAQEKAEQVDWQIDQLDENEQGSVKTAGRVRYLISDQWREIELNGAFEVNGSKITQWQ